jgi:hypothetical protein
MSKRSAVRSYTKRKESAVCHDHVCKKSWKMKVCGEYPAAKQNSRTLCHVIYNRINIQFSSCLAKSDSMQVALV